METFLWIGSAVGAVLGGLHALYVYRDISARAAKNGNRNGNGNGKGGQIRALYHGLWTFALWTLFGSYVLGFWLIGSVGRTLAGLKR